MAGMLTIIANANNSMSAYTSSMGVDRSDKKLYVHITPYIKSLIPVICIWKPSAQGWASMLTLAKITA